MLKKRQEKEAFLAPTIHYTVLSWKDQFSSNPYIYTVKQRGRIPRSEETGIPIQFGKRDRNVK